MSGGTQTVKQDNNPPDWAAPGFAQVGKDATKLYNNKNNGGNVYQGDTVVGMGNRLVNGYNDLISSGANPQKFTTAINRYTDMTNDRTSAFGDINRLASGINYKPSSLAGFDEAMAGARGVADPSNNLTGIASGVNGIGTEADYRRILGDAGGKSAADQNLTDMASGAYLKEGNPYYRELLDKEINSAQDKMQTMYAGKGRYGSMSAQKGIGDMTSNMLLQGLNEDWNRNQANMLTANSMIDAQRNAGINNRLNAVSGITGVQGQNLSNQMAAANQMTNARAAEAGLLSDIAGNRFSADQSNQLNAINAAQTQAGMYDLANQNRMAESNQQLQAANMLQQAQQQEYENRLTGANAQITAGTAFDAQRQAELDDAVARWYANDNEDWNRLAMYTQALSGSAQNYGTQTQQTRKSLGIQDIFGMLLSDRRRKTNVIRVGRDARGLGLYEFAYRSDPSVRYRGVMADEVETVDPVAVVDLGPFKVVSYVRLGLEMEAA